MLVLMVVMASTVKLLGFVAGDRRASERRQWAIQTVSNVMERISGRSSG